MSGEDATGPSCSGARASLLGFFAREIGLDRLVELTAHLAGCAACAALFTEHGRAFGLVRTDFLEFLDPDEEARRALPHPITLLAAPLEILRAGQLARVHLAERPPAVRFRGGPTAGGAVAQASRVVLGGLKLAIAWTSDAPPALVLTATGHGQPARLVARIRWSDGGLVEAHLTIGKPHRIQVPPGVTLAGVAFA